MDIQTIQLAEIEQFPAHDTLILTVNNRHARRLVQEWPAMFPRDRSVMPIPRILPLQAWLRLCSEDLVFSASTLPDVSVDDFVATQLWQQAITRCEQENVLLNVPQAAKLALEAADLLHEWHIDVEEAEITPDYARFRQWHQGYQEILSSLQVQDKTQGFERLLQAMEAQQLSFEFSRLVLAGFTELSPRIWRLLRAVRHAGCQVYQLDLDTPPAQEVQAVSQPDHAAEWQAAAQWAHTQLLANPQGRYAIVVPNLTADAAHARRVLHRSLHADGLAFNVAVAPALSSWPIVEAALAWLSLSRALSETSTFRPADVGAALLGGYCVGQREEAGGRARLDAKWRRQGRLQVSQNALLKELHAHAPQLALAWQTVREKAHDCPERASLEVWAQHMRELLSCWGFPGEAPLDSHAWQVLEAFDQLLHRLACLSPILPACSWPKARHLLHQLADETLFQPQRDASARLDVLGLLESEGGRWDAVWVMGLSDEVLPARPRPNPLIPLTVLRRVGAPRATPEREMQWAKAMFEALQRLAPTVYVSYPCHEGEMVVKPSPLLQDISITEGQPEPVPVEPAALEALRDDQGPPLCLRGQAQGGSQLLELQARNPLWAFARFRLGAQELPDYAEIAPATVRGQFLHHAMELLWTTVADQATLLQYASENQLDDTVSKAVAQAANKLLYEFPPIVRTLEVARAQEIVMRWLMCEMERPAFRVSDLETQGEWVHAGLRLRLRVDRVDQLADGRRLVMDYKTGSSKPSFLPGWSRERLIELQLPLYADWLCAQEIPVAGLALVQLHARAINAVGLCHGDVGLESLTTIPRDNVFDGRSWDAVIQEWRTALQGLAQEYVNGVARNEVVNQADLQYCEVLPFLRLEDPLKEDDRVTTT